MPDDLRPPSPIRPAGPISKALRFGAAFGAAVGSLVLVAGSVASVSTGGVGAAPAALEPVAAVPPLVALAAVELISDGDVEAIGGALVQIEEIAKPTPTATLVPPSPTATTTAVPPPAPTPTVVPPSATPRPMQAAAPPPPPPPPPLATAPPPPAASSLDTSPMDAYARALLSGTNARRVSNGLAPLAENGYLNGIARIRSQDMADHNYFAHVSPITGDDAFGLMDKHGVPYGWAGENLAKNNYPESECVDVAEQALWESPPHRENILNPHYTDVGIALVVDATGMKYFTIVFTGPA